MDKHTLVERLGIPYRDLRQMDPFIAQPYPAAILVREKAIVLSLENIRLITSKVRRLDSGPNPDLSPDLNLNPHPHPHTHPNVRR